MPVMHSFDVFFNLRLNKRLNKHSTRRWFDAQSRSLWRHCDASEHADAHDILCYATWELFDIADISFNDVRKGWSDYYLH